MRYATAAAFRQALEQRLKDEATDTGLTLARLRKRVAFELFLRRLLAVAPERWVLKGALALDFRLTTPTRSTKDIDLGRDDDEDAAIRDIAAAQTLALDDYFTFQANRTDELDDDDDQLIAMRFHITAQLAGRIFEQFRLDISLADSLSYEPDIVKSTGLLTFADIPPLALPAIPIPQHLAEKVHAYTRAYGGDTMRPSTRPKDLIDILLIAASTEISARALRKALQHTFHERARQPLPSNLPPPPDAWSDPYKRLAQSVGIETDLCLAHTSAAAFLDPVLDGSADDLWDPHSRVWRQTDSRRPSIHPAS
jgi:predicted nucleotidyltransferase component of viral defense system